MTASSEPDRLGEDEVSNIERIRHAALKSFAIHGTSATTLRSVAAAAGVSLGLVQHHFATKAGLIKAVDDHVLSVVIAAISQPLSSPPHSKRSGDSVAEVGDRVTRFIADETDVADYVGRALVEGSPVGMMIFDALVGFGMIRWNQRSERGETRADVDLHWAVLNSLVLFLGTLILRPHIDRHLPVELTTPEQLRRWDSAVNDLLRRGLFRQVD